MRQWWLSGVLAGLLIVSAFSVIVARHEARKSFFELQHLETTRDELNVDWGRLQLEHATWADASRVEHMARTDLGLVKKAPERVVVVVEKQSEAKEGPN